MHSFLVSAPPDIKPSPDVLEVSPDPSIGIEEVRKIIGFLSRKPLQSENNTVIIYQAEKMTLPAQHAILKTLEEPPGNSQIYLVTKYPDSLLPTILSRVQLLLSTNYQLPTTTDIAKSKELIDKLIAAPGVGKRMAIIDSASFTRESFSKFLDDLEHIMHSQIQSTQLPTTIYKLLVDTRKYLNANVTLRLVLDFFALNISLGTG